MATKTATDTAAAKLAESVMARLIIGPGVPDSSAHAFASLFAALLADDTKLVVTRAEYHGLDRVILGALLDGPDGPAGLVPLAVLVSDESAGAMRPLSPEDIARADARSAADREREARRGYL